MTVRGTSTLRVSVRGLSGIERALRPWLEPELTNVLDVANRGAARSLAKDVKAEAAPVSKHMARAVRVKRARTGKPGWVVGSKRKTYPWWHMTIGGTKAHGPRRSAALIFVPGFEPYLGASSHGVGNSVVRASRVSGVPANDIVERAARKGERAAVDEIDRQVTAVTGT
ncbi:MAG TPA: hypothetical protein VIU37_11895 [Candidatus Limnocylindrales bacterium]